TLARPARDRFSVGPAVPPWRGPERTRGCLRCRRDQGTCRGQPAGSDPAGLAGPPVAGHRRTAGGRGTPVAGPEAGGTRRAGGTVRRLPGAARAGDRKSTRLNSSHVKISYAVFCLKKKNTTKP